MKGLINGFTIFGLNIKFYGIIMAFAMLVGVLLACKNAKKRPAIEQTPHHRSEEKIYSMISLP